MLRFSSLFRFILLLLCTRFDSLLSKSVLLCYRESYEINCSDDEFIVVKDAVFGYLPSYQSSNQFRNSTCAIPDSYKSNLNDCGISLLQNISAKCSGIKSCKIEVMHSQYFQIHSPLCPENAIKLPILNLYVNYECIPKDLIQSVDEISDEIHFIGGYITSVGYLSLKANARDEYEYIANNFIRDKLLPLQKSFRPKTQLISKFPIVFQFQILENTLYPNQNTKVKDLCQIGKLYYQDYYAFTPTSKNQGEKPMIFCQSSFEMVGGNILPIIAQQIDITANVNFNNSLNMKRGLLIKYTTIFCPHLSFDNANVAYDHNLINRAHVEVTGYAKIDCQPGYFLYSSSNNSLSNDTTVIIKCNHDTGNWNQALGSLKCLKKLPIQFTTNSATTQKPTYTTQFITTPNANEDPKSTTSISTETQKGTTTYGSTIIPVIIVGSSTIIGATTPQPSYVTKYILPSIAFIFVLFCIFGYFLFKKKGKLKCISLDCATFPKMFSKKENILKFHRRNHYDFYETARYQQVRGSMTPMSGSLALISVSRQSTRTLTTMAGSKPTIESRDSFPNYKNSSDFEINQIQIGDELPTKLPKESPMMRMLKSASSLRNHSIGTLRPYSLSKHSFDRGSNISDGRFFSSQAALLKNRRNINSEFIEMHPSMWTSDITPSKTIPNRFPNHSHSDISNLNHKTYSPTVDTYLEPTVEVSNQLDEEESGQLSSQIQRKKSEDYMIYDQSRISSNNMDSISPSSITESLTDLNQNDSEENKRFSMISNNYYGITANDYNPKYNLPRTTYPIVERNISNNNFRNSNESVYECIDDGPLIQNTMERRRMALPPPPKDD